jgi:CO/xanthine dehydrogenase FAD-binding subunit
MITEYNRPGSLEEALELLAREEPRTLPLGGGSRLNQPTKEQFAVVDLANLGLDTLEVKGNTIELGAALKLGILLERAEADDPSLESGLVKAIQREGTHNLRQVATVAGALVGADRRSSFALAMLALDAALTLHPGNEILSLGDLLPLRRENLPGHLITKVTIPNNVRLSYEYVARSPGDWSLVSAALAVWPSGRARLALGGYGEGPILAFDGQVDDGLEVAAQSAYSHAGDEWASAEYRQEIAGVLAKRCYDEISG